MRSSRRSSRERRQTGETSDKAGDPRDLGVASLLFFYFAFSLLPNCKKPQMPSKLNPEIASFDCQSPFSMSNAFQYHYQ